MKDLENYKDIMIRTGARQRANGDENGKRLYVLTGMIKSVGGKFLDRLHDKIKKYEHDPTDARGIGIM